MDMGDVFQQFDGHEQVVFGRDEDSGLRVIIAIHSTRLGPSLGGTRFYPYDDDGAALTDVLRLSRAMAYKAAAAGLDLGGGKAVIIGDPTTDKTEALLRAYGRLVESLGGRYVTACDVGTYPADMAIVARETRWATGADPVEGGSGDSGVLTAYGTFVGLQACAEEVWKSPSLHGKHVAIQGAGKVGRRLAAYVHALGAVLNDETIGELQCRVVAGAANNQLAESRHGEALQDAGVLYAPDYVINAGGVIQVADELHPDGYSEERARARTAAVGDRLRTVFALARRDGVTTAVAADRFAEQRMASVGGLRRFWLPL
jgi:valine dehydrogenase (NAD+)